MVLESGRWQAQACLRCPALMVASICETVWKWRRPNRSLRASAACCSYYTCSCQERLNSYESQPVKRESPGPAGHDCCALARSRLRELAWHGRHVSTDRYLTSPCTWVAGLGRRRSGPPSNSTSPPMAAGARRTCGCIARAGPSRDGRVSPAASWAQSCSSLASFCACRNCRSCLC